jgi:hypothetical protein
MFVFLKRQNYQKRLENTDYRYGIDNGNACRKLFAASKQ